MTFKATILTIFPEMFPGTLGHSLAGNALKKGIWDLEIIDIRDFGLTKHKNVDDEPYGGGSGMVMRADVLGEALDKAIQSSKTDIIYYMSPRGGIFNQGKACEIVEEKNIIILCGRFEGIDERVIHEYNVREISIGDFVLSGGEIACLAMLDACVRLLPGVLGNPETLSEESFSIRNSNLLEYPLYTRPEVWRENKVPEVLLSGNHAKIQEWKLSQSKEITKKRRPELLK